MRYHAHIIKVANEQPLVSSQLALFFENRAFLTQDLSVISTETMNYSRRCIENCDFVIMIIGNSYGQTNMSGVSQMHLSYLTAQAKRKPMLIFINTNDTGVWERQRQDFVSLVEKQNQQNITYYQYEQVFAQYLNNAYKNFSSHLAEPNYTRCHPENMAKRSTTAASQTINVLQNTEQMSTRAAAIKPQVLTQMYQQHAMDEQLYKNQPVKVYNDTDKQALEKLSSIKPKVTLVSIDDYLTVEYLAHAYQDGNLTEVTLTEMMTWQQILTIMQKLNQPFSTDTFARSLNAVLSQMAAEQIKSVMPKAHAVSRCQAKKSVLQYIMQQLSDNNWLEKSTDNQPSARELWQLTPSALKAII